MKYEIKYYCRVKLKLPLSRNSFLKEPPKDDFEEYAFGVIDRSVTYFIACLVGFYIDNSNCVCYTLLE